MPDPKAIEGQGFHTNPERINRDGRPKGSRNLSTILREMLEEEIEVTTDTGKEKKKLQDVMISRLLKAATKSGDLKPTQLRAIQEIFDRVDGKSKQTNELIISEDQVFEVGGKEIKF